MPEAPRRILHRPPLLDVRHLHACSTGFPCIHDISLSVEHGTIVGLVGPDGCGMQTLLDCISGITTIDRGETWFDGEPTSCLRADQIARLGLLRTFRHPRIFPGMSCMENMLACRPAMHAPLHELFRPARRKEVSRALDLLAFFGLHERCHHHAAELSAWQARLLECAMALMSEPRLLLLDEPFDALPGSLLDKHVERLQRLNAELGLSLLVASRRLHPLLNMAEHIYVLWRGYMLRAGTPQEIRNNRPAVHHDDTAQQARQATDRASG